MEGRREQFRAELADAGAADPDRERERRDRPLGLVRRVVRQGAPGARRHEPGRRSVLQLHDPRTDRAWWGSSLRQDQPLLGLVSRLAPAIVSGNAVVAVASESAPLPAVSLGEVLATSDVPGGVVNILTGRVAELVPWLAGHMDVNAIDVTGVPDELREQVDELAAENVKRIHRGPDADPFSTAAQSPYEITALMEFKTVWHPMGA